MNLTPEYYKKMRAAVGAASRAEHLLHTMEFDDAETWSRRAVELWDEINPADKRSALETSALRNMLEILIKCLRANKKIDEARDVEARIKSL